MRRSTFLALALAGALAGLAPAHAQAPVHGPERNKAMIVANFAHFARWPASAFDGERAPLRLCVVQRSRSVAAAFQALEGQRVGARTLHVDLEPPAGAAGCHLLFAHESAGAAAPAALAAAAPGSTLTIGDFDGALARGGMIELVQVNDTLRFDVDLRALRERQLALSSEVLRLARQTR